MDRGVYWRAAKRAFDQRRSSCPCDKDCYSRRKEIPQQIVRRQNPKLPGGGNENTLINRASRSGNQLCCPDLCPTNKYARSTTAATACRGHKETWRCYEQ